MYLSLAAVVVLVVVAGHAAPGALFGRFRWSDQLPGYLGACLVVAMVGTLGYVTMRRNDDYRTVVSIWSDVVAKRPNNSRAHNNLGTAFHIKGQLEKARTHYAEAVRIKPDFAAAHYSTVLRLRPQPRRDTLSPGPDPGSPGKDRGGRHLEAAVQLEPNHARARSALADLRSGITRVTP